MAVASAGSMENVELGFAPQQTAVATIGGTTAGYIESDVNVDLSREYAFVKGGLTPIKHTVTGKGLTASFTAREILLENLQQAWDSDAAAISSSVYTVDADVGATIALLLKTYAPNGSTHTTPASAPISRVISVPKALATGDGAYAIPKATSGETNQTLSFEFIALGDTASNELLATVTDSYA